MAVIAIALFVWIVAAVCYLIMKKIQPGEARLYLIYAIFVCIAFTAVVTYHIFWE